MKMQLPQSLKQKGTNKVITVKMARDGKRGLVERTTVIDNDTAHAQTIIECINEQYRFAATQADPTSPFVMTSYSLLSLGDVPPGVEFNQFAYNELNLLLSAIDGREGATLMRLGWDEKKRLVHASMKQQDTKNNQSSIAHEVWFDPANQWRVVERQQIHPSNSLLVRMTYGQSVDGLSYPVKIEQTSIRQRDAKSEVSEVEMTLEVARTSRPESDYRLSGYGLPEPVDVTAVPSRRTPNYVWLLAGAVFCLVIAVVSRYLLRRKVA